MFSFHLLVAKTEESALQSCRQIKRYCPTVKSGDFWISGKTPGAQKGIVYCDMETDEGKI